MGLLEKLGLKQPRITQEMVNARQAEAVEAVKLLNPFVAKDKETEKTRLQFALRLSKTAKSPAALDIKYDDLGAILTEAKAALKAAKQRKIEIEAEEIAAGENGSATLDTMIEALGGSAKSEEAKTFVKAALKARFKIDTLEGEMTTKALPKLYKVLGSVPEWQVRDNDSLKNIKRVRQGPEGASYFTSDTQEIYLELGRTGTFHFTNENYTTDSGKKTKVDSFSVTTLHEIGHAVDDQLGFMDGRELQTKYGGWKMEKRDEIAGRIAAEKGFLQGWSKAYAPAPLIQVLDGVLDKGKIDLTEWDRKAGEIGQVFGAKTDDQLTGEILADPGIVLAETSRETFARDNSWPANTDNEVNTARIRVGRAWGTLRQEIQGVIAIMLERKVPAAAEVARLLARLRGLQTNLAPADRTKLETHPAVELCRAIRIAGSNSGLWDQGAGAAGKWAIGGRVYQQSYSKSWVSYAAEVRGRGISQYQFRAPGEWFAELYALYYLGKLPKTHADAQWIAAEIDTVAAPAEAA